MEEKNCSRFWQNRATGESTRCSTLQNASKNEELDGSNGRHLFKMLKKQKNSHRFRFVDPYKIGYVRPMEGKTMKGNQINQRAQVLAKRLVGTSDDQICIVPCNVGDHWILTIINPHKEEVCLLDPLFPRIHDDRWQTVVDMTLKLFFAETKNTKARKKSVWKVMKAPKQPDGMQCGFFVLRYMRQLIQFDGSLDMASM
ncbi:hypothetical protein ACS0TY_023638 [Phlomoides rotata]